MKTEILRLCLCCPSGARYSFAVKMSPSKEIAERKSTAMDLHVLYEVLATLHGAEAEKLTNIIQDIKDGKVDRETMERVLREYEAMLPSNHG